MSDTHQTLLVDSVVTVSKQTYVDLKEALVKIDNRIHVGKTKDGRFCIVLFAATGQPVGFAVDTYTGPG